MNLFRPHLNKPLANHIYCEKKNKEQIFKLIKAMVIIKVTIFNIYLCVYLDSLNYLRTTLKYNANIYIFHADGWDCRNVINCCSELVLAAGHAITFNVHLFGFVAPQVFDI